MHRTYYILISLLVHTILYSQTIDVTTSADSGAGSLRQAITDINSGSDISNTINLQIPGNTLISIGSDLPVIKKNTEIISTGNQTIDGNGPNATNSYQGGTEVQTGTLSIPDPGALGSPTANLTFTGGTLQSTQTGTLPNPIILQSAGRLYVAAGTVLNAIGSISGPGAILKQGPGTLNLSSATNNYRGGTEIQAGTLSLPRPQALGTPTANLSLNGVALQATQTYTLPNPIVASFAGAIEVFPDKTLYTTGKVSGSGTIDKTGDGTWHQAGTSTHTGNLNIDQGTLQIDGTLPSNITVNSGATLEGSGLAGGDVTNNGTLSPSNAAVGALTIGGNYIQTSSGTLHLELLPNSMSNHLIVTGSAMLDGTLPKPRAWNLPHRRALQSHSCKWWTYRPLPPNQFQ